MKAPRTTAIHQCRPVGRRVLGTQPSMIYNESGFRKTVVVLEADCSCGKNHAWNAAVDIHDLTPTVPWTSDHERKEWTTCL